MTKEQEIFYFKDFKIYHGGNSLKISTDAILLGSWARKKKNAKRILDIGTGSGVIAFMLSKAYKESKIIGIELNSKSAEQCYENLSLNPEIQNIDFINADIREWETDHQFDLIVSNPPFFNNSLKPTNEILKGAKHNLSLSPEDIFVFASKKLSQEGSLFLIYPIELAEEVYKIAKANKLYLISEASIYPKPQSKVKRVLFEFGTSKVKQTELEEIFIEKGKRHEYHESYINLCKDYYLKF